jgi:HEAT repeat protein
MKSGLPDRFSFDGVQLGPSTDYVGLVREQLSSGSVWPSGDSGPHQGVRRVIDAAEGTTTERRLLDAVLELLADEDTAVRTSAIHLAWDYADKVNAETLLQALNDHPSLYEGVKAINLPQSYMPDLGWGLIQAMNANPRPGARVIARLRRAAEDPVNGFRVFGGLAAHDPDWLIEHATALVSHQPVRARIILGNLKTPKRREQFIRALANEPASFRQELAGVIADKVQNNDERDRLNALLR